MKGSILEDTKRYCNLPPKEETPFDPDIVIHINTTFALLNRAAGIGPEKGYRIEDSKNTWEEFTDDTIILGMVKDYILVSARLTFDPPANATIIESMRKTIDKLEFHLGVKAEEVTADE